MVKIWKSNSEILFCFVVILVFLMTLGFPVSGAEETEEIYDWEDERAQLTGDIFVLDEASLTELVPEEERDDFSLFLTDRLDYQLRENRYTGEQIERLEQFSGSELSYDELIEFSEYFTLVAIKAERGFDVDTADLRVNLYVSEVVDISEGRIYNRVTDYEFLVSEEQLIDRDALRLLPRGEGMIAYVMPRLYSQYLTVEIRSVVDNTFRTHTATLEQLVWQEE